MPPLLDDFIHNRVCKLKCEKFLTRPGGYATASKSVPPTQGISKRIVESKGSIQAILPLSLSIYFLKIVSLPFNLQVL